MPPVRRKISSGVLKQIRDTNQNHNNSAKSEITLDVQTPVKNTGNDKNFTPTWTQNLTDYFSEYCRSSGIHGVRYLGERGRFVVEKLVWSIIITGVCYLCISLILKSYNKWTNSPVIVTFATRETPIWKIPFPAVTICPEIKSDPEILNYTEVVLQKILNRNISAEKERYFQSLSLICTGVDKDGDFIQYLTNMNNTVSESIIDDLFDVAPELHNMSTITWLGREVTEDVLSYSVTSEGFCYSFNMLDQDELLVNAEKYVTKRSKNNTRSRKWSLEDGYPPGDKMDAFPRRTFITGVNGGFMFDIFTNHSHLDYLCKESLQGFKVTLHHPSQLPDMDQHFRVPLDQAVLVAIKPRMITVNKDLKSYKPEIRQCYFAHEKRLTFFGHYTQQNCLDECFSNYTLRECGCIAFYMPKNDSSPICGPGSKDCVDNSETNYILNQIDLGSNNFGDNTQCACLPSCTALEYDIEISQTDWNWRESIQVFAQINDKIKSIFNYEKTHASRIAVYFKELQFLTSERHELYGYLDFFSNTGGLLGLFIGFSVTSAIEILYFLTLRLACNIRKFGRKFWSGEASFVNEENVQESSG